MADEVIREGSWLCPNCARTNRGAQLRCEGCGETREAVDFVYDPAGPVVTEPAKVQEALAGPDWICSYCHTSSAHGAARCRQCGAPRDGADRQRKWLPGQPVPLGGTRPSAGPLPLVLAFLGFAFVAWLMSGGAPPRAPSARPPASARQLEATVADARWVRIVAIEAGTELIEEAWQDEVPPGARVLSTRQEATGWREVPAGTRRVPRTVDSPVQVGTERVKVRVEDLGNGRFREVYEERPRFENRSTNVLDEEPAFRREPTYRTRVTYAVGRPVAVRQARRSGEAAEPPEWPEVSLAAGEREGPRSETFSVELRAADGRSFWYSPPTYGEYLRLKPGTPCSFRPGEGDAAESVVPH